jgi:hypothetical protein
MDAWKHNLHDINAEIAISSPLGTTNAGYIRIGKTDQPYHTKATIQARCGEFAPPCCNGIDVIWRALKDGLRRLMPTQDESLELRAISAAAAKSDDNLKNSSRENSIRADKGSVENDKEKMARMRLLRQQNFRLRAVGIDVDEMDLSKKKDANKVQRLLGKLIRLQQAHSGNKIES